MFSCLPSNCNYSSHCCAGAYCQVNSMRMSKICKCTMSLFSYKSNDSLWRYLRDSNIHGFLTSIVLSKCRLLIQNSLLPLNFYFNNPEPDYICSHFGIPRTTKHWITLCMPLTCHWILIEFLLYWFTGNHRSLASICGPLVIMCRSCAVVSLYIKMYMCICIYVYLYVYVHSSICISLYGKRPLVLWHSFHYTPQCLSHWVMSHLMIWIDYFKMAEKHEHRKWVLNKNP